MNGCPRLSNQYRNGCTPNVSRRRPDPFLQEPAIEIRMVGDDEHDSAYQIVDGAIVDAVTGYHLIGPLWGRSA